MDPALAIETAARSSQIPIDEAALRGDSAIQLFYCNAVIFLTGGSGFLGKQLIEKLFRSCNVQKVYMLIRPKKGKTIQQRLADVFNDPLYESLCKTRPEFVDKVIAMEGDISEVGLGLSNDDWKTITEEVNIIFNVAATVNFEEPLRAATLTNVRATREMLRLAKACKGLRSFVHISTAYVHSTFDRIKADIFEQFYPCPLSPTLMIQMAENMDEDKLKAITPELIKGWPNTYAYTKAISEEVLRTMAEDLPVCIIRPSIVLCAYREAALGWLDSSTVLGPSGLILGSITGVLRVTIANQDIKVDLIPVDYVNNAVLSAGWITAVNHKKDNKEIKIYNVTSYSNYLKWRTMSAILNSKVGQLVPAKALWYCFTIETSNKLVYNILNWILHFIPAYFVDGICLLIGKKPRLTKIYSLIHKMTNVMSYFTLNEWNFDDTNKQELLQNMSATDKTIFNFDADTINWPDYIVIWSVGLRKYIIKDDLKDTEYSLKKQFCLRIVHYIVVVIYFYVIWLLLSLIFNVISWIF